MDEGLVLKIDKVTNIIIVIIIIVITNIIIIIFILIIIIVMWYHQIKTKTGAWVGLQ